MRIDSPRSVYPRESKARHGWDFYQLPARGRGWRSRTAVRSPHEKLLWPPIHGFDAMKPGIDFVKQLDTQVSQCHVLLAVIGPHWLDIKDHSGQRRIDSERDYVRIELASALKRDIPVIPVLVDGAVLPSEDELPADLKPLARRQALELRHTRFSA